MRGVLALVATGLAALAGVVASLDGDADLVPFYFGLTFLGAVGAWGTHHPFEGRRKWLARGATVLWLVAALWVGLLLVWYLMNGGCDCPGPLPTEKTYIGLTATVYHLVGLYGGAVLMVLATFPPSRGRWVDGAG
jgi:hypothetical protein